VAAEVAAAQVAAGAMAGNGPVSGVMDEHSGPVQMTSESWGVLFHVSKICHRSVSSEGVTFCLLTSQLIISSLYSLSTAPCPLQLPKPAC
jgi:hypothetical protein